MEGLVIYTICSNHVITIFYLSALNLGSYEAIVLFVIEKLKSVVSPKKIKIRVLHTNDGYTVGDNELQKMNKNRPNDKLRQIYKKIGFKIKSITYTNDKNKISFSMFDMCFDQDKSNNIARKSRPSINLKCQIVLSNQVRLVKN
jgi:hypothetical protein